MIFKDGRYKYKKGKVEIEILVLNGEVLILPKDDNPFFVRLDYLLNKDNWEEVTCR